MSPRSNRLVYLTRMRMILSVSPHRLAPLLLAAALTACSTVKHEPGPGANSALARQCAKALQMAAEDIDGARGIQGLGALSVMRASHTHGSAQTAQFRGKYEECIEKALRAQTYVRDAYRAQAQAQDR